MFVKMVFAGPHVGIACPFGRVGNADISYNSRSAITLIDRGEESFCRYTGRPIVVLLSHGSVRSVMQEGAPSVRLVARSDRECRHCRSTEEMRADGDANRHPRGFGNELAH